MLVDKDRLSHWFAVGVIAWTAYCLVLGLPIFHLGLGVSAIRVVAFFAGAGLVQLAVTPWIFWARATLENPNGRFAHQIAAGCVWVCSALILLLCVVQYGKAIDHTHFGARLLIIVSTVAAFGVVALIVGVSLGRRAAERSRR